MEIKEEPIETDRLAYYVICSCPHCEIDFTIKTMRFELSEMLGTPDHIVSCPVCTCDAVVDDKDEEYI
jgi:hypothetical protein